jgi:hypothetical protein
MTPNKQAALKTIKMIHLASDDRHMYPPVFLEEWKEPNTSISHNYIKIYINYNQI